MMKTCAVIFIISFTLQLAVMLITGGYIHPEVYEYDEIARNLLTKHVFMCHRLGTEYYSLVPPVYPLLYAAVCALSNYSHTAVLLVQMALYALSCVLIYMIGANVFDRRVGIIAAVLSIFHPGLVLYSTTKLHELSTVTFVFFLTIFAMIVSKDGSSYKKSFTVAALIALSVLTRATIVIFVPLFLLWFLWENGRFTAKRSLWFKSFLIAAIAGLLIAPWVVRNYFVHHEFVFMQTPSVDLWVGNNPNATGGNYLADGKPVFDSMPKEFIENIYASDEMGQDRIFKEAAYGFIKRNPLKFIKLYFKKLYYFWWFSPSSGVLYPAKYLRMYKILYGLYALFFFIGLRNIFFRKVKVNAEKAVLLLAFLISISVFQSFFYIEGRHRWAIEPIFLVISAAGIAGFVPQNVFWKSGLSDGKNKNC